MFPTCGVLILTSSMMIGKAEKLPQGQVIDITAMESEPTVAGRREKQIDHLVYHLYGLTEEEIRIVEGKE